MYHVVGIQRREYTSKRTGALIRGYNVFCTFENEYISGCGVDTIWLSDSMYDAAGGLGVGDDIEVMYNKYGRVSKVEVV